MVDTNVHGTERVLDAAIEAGIGRIVYVSTVGVFGNTHERIVDETYRRDGDDFLSCYDETKFRAHELALDRIAQGAPIVIVQPAGVYGPGDHSEIANIIDQVRTGKLKMMVFPELGLDLVHVDDVADGIVNALDRGRVGESYVLGGEITRMRNLVELVAEMTGRKAPKRALPVGLMKISAPGRAAGRQGARLPAQPARADPDLRRRDAVGERREGAPRARLRPAGSYGHARRRR